MRTYNSYATAVRTLIYLIINKIINGSSSTSFDLTRGTGPDIQGDFRFQYSQELAWKHPAYAQQTRRSLLSH